MEIKYLNDELAQEKIESYQRIIKTVMENYIPNDSSTAATASSFDIEKAKKNMENDPGIMLARKMIDDTILFSVPKLIVTVETEGDRQLLGRIIGK